MSEFTVGKRFKPFFFIRIAKQTRKHKSELLWKYFLLSVGLNCLKFLWYRNASDGNVQHDAEISSARVAAEQDVAKDNKDVLQHIDSKSKSLA